MTTTIHPYSDARRLSFKRRVLSSRLFHLEQEIETVLDEIAQLSRLGHYEEADRVELHLVDLTREALNHRSALEDRTPLVDVLAPRLASLAWGAAS